MATDSAAVSDERRVRRIEDLVRRLENIADPESREIAEQLMQAVLDLHGAGLEKMMDLTFESGAAGEALIRRFANDSLVSSLLVLHGFHPDDLETRVRQVLAKAPGHVELLSVLDGVVHVRLSSGGCGSAEPEEESLKVMLRGSIPDVTEIVVHHTAAMNSFVPLLSLGSTPSRAG